MNDPVAHTQSHTGQADVHRCCQDDHALEPCVPCHHASCHHGPVDSCMTKPILCLRNAERGACCGLPQPQDGLCHAAHCAVCATIHHSRMQLWAHPWGSVWRAVVHPPCAWRVQTCACGIVIVQMIGLHVHLSCTQQGWPCSIGTSYADCACSCSAHVVLLLYAEATAGLMLVQSPITYHRDGKMGCATLLLVGMLSNPPSGSAAAGRLLLVAGTHDLECKWQWAIVIVCSASWHSAHWCLLIRS